MKGLKLKVYLEGSGAGYLTNDMLQGIASSWAACGKDYCFQLCNSAAGADVVLALYEDLPSIDRDHLEKTAAFYSVAPRNLATILLTEMLAPESEAELDIALSDVFDMYKAKFLSRR